MPPAASCVTLSARVRRMSIIEVEIKGRPCAKLLNIIRTPEEKYMYIYIYIYAHYAGLLQRRRDFSNICKPLRGRSTSV